MTKSLFLLLVGTFLSAASYSQLEYYTPKTPIEQQPEKMGRHESGDKLVSISPNVIIQPELGVRAAGGMNFQIFLGKKVSLDADLLVGKNYVHAGPGVIALPFWLLLFSSSDSFEDQDIKNFFIMVALGVLSLEHTSYHFRLDDNLELSPYISFLRYRINHIVTETKSKDEQFVFATGIHINKYLGRFFISPYAEYNIGYNDKLSGFNAGVGIGMSFIAK
jgi:hypothetical protein